MAKATKHQNSNMNSSITETDSDIKPNVSRRSFLAASIAGAAVVTTGCSVADTVMGGSSSRHEFPGNLSTDKPFDSLREYIAALEEHDLLLRIPRLDQDNYEMTALIYRLTEEHRWNRAPAVLVEEIKINGKWVKGPVLTNTHGHWHSEAVAFGLNPHPTNPTASYRKAIDHMSGLISKGKFPSIPPNKIAREDAPCKEISLEGNDIDITKFAFIQTNPADGGRYVNTGSVMTTDPEMGMNMGIYRCQIQGPRKMSINPEPNQTSWKHIKAAEARGEKFAPVSIVVGQDPYVWTVSGSRVVNRRMSKGAVDELAVAGGLRGKAIDVVKSDNSNIIIPANAEMVIEGEVRFNERAPVPEAPFGEMMGYMGPQKPDNFVMTITKITHRKNPWIMNQFTGATRGYATSPTTALYNESFKRLVPDLIEIHSPLHAPGVTYVRIKKTKAGAGLRAGKMLAKIVPIYKLVIVVDEDIDVLDPPQVENAIAARWQPADAHAIVSGKGMPLDPSLAGTGPDYASSKLVIDATRSLPEEGGPAVWAKRNRTLLDELAPDAIKRVDEKFSDLILGNRRW